MKELYVEYSGFNCNEKYNQFRLCFSQFLNDFFFSSEFDETENDVFESGKSSIFRSQEQGQMTSKWSKYLTPKNGDES